MKLIQVCLLHARSSIQICFFRILMIPCFKRKLTYLGMELKGLFEAFRMEGVEALLDGATADADGRTEVRASLSSPM